MVGLDEMGGCSSSFISIHVGCSVFLDDEFVLFIVTPTSSDQSRGLSNPNTNPKKCKYIDIYCK